MGKSFGEWVKEKARSAEKAVTRTLESIGIDTPAEKAIAGAVLGGALFGPVGATAGAAIGSGEAARAGRRVVEKLRSIEETLTGKKAERALEAAQEEMRSLRPPPLSAYLPTPDQYPRYQAPTPQQLAQMGRQFVSQTEQAFGYTPVEDLRRAYEDYLRRLFAEERARESALATTALMTSGGATSPALASVLAQKSRELATREAGRALEAHLAYQQALEREIARRMGYAFRFMPEARTTMERAYQLGELAPFEYAVRYGGTRYAYEGLLPLAMQYQAARAGQAYQMARALGQQTGMWNLIGQLLGGVASLGTALALRG